MRTIRIYEKGHYQLQQEVLLSASASQHVAVVLRLQEGASLTLFGGEDIEYSATLIAVKKKQVTVRIDALCPISRESPLSIHLAQAISKGDRMEWVVQKAVELGVSQITPLMSARCVVKLDAERMAKKVQQWQAIAIAACEQSGRNTIPLIAQPMPFARFIQEDHSKLKLILHPEGGKNWRDYTISQDVTVLIGPEGGFCEDEVQEAMRRDFQPLSLGPRILRTETAAICALSVLQALRGDL